jgi:creatinine amidohydrolase
MTTVIWGELTGPEIAARAGADSLVILPLGCTEQHAHHLPVDTDTHQVETLAVVGATKARDRFEVDALVLPALPYGPSSEHYGLPGTISIPSDVYMAFVRSVLWSVIELSFRRVAIVRGCGGHWVVPGLLWDLKADAVRAGHDITLYLLDASAGWNEIQQGRWPGSDGGHASVMETALALDSRPNLVRSEAHTAPKVQNFIERHQEGEILLFADVTSSGALGDAAPAIAGSSAGIWDEVTDQFAERLRLLDLRYHGTNRA